MLWKTAIRHLSGNGKSAKLQVFIFHRVLPKTDTLMAGEPSVEEFDWMIRFIAGTYTVLTFGDAVSRLQSGTLPPGCACITFDDGYQNNATLAAPTLKKYGVSATFFIATAYLDRQRMWNDKVIEAVRHMPDGEFDRTPYGLPPCQLGSDVTRAECISQLLGVLKYLPHDQRSELSESLTNAANIGESYDTMMTPSEVRTLRNSGMEIGAHTHTHPILSGLPDSVAETELARSKDELEAILGESITSFAYPNGNTRRDLGPQHATMAKKLGFRAAATTDWGIATMHTNPFLIPRFTPWDRTPHRFAMRCTLAMGKPFKPTNDAAA